MYIRSLVIQSHTTTQSHPHTPTLSTSHTLGNVPLSPRVCAIVQDQFLCRLLLPNLSLLSILPRKSYTNTISELFLTVNSQKEFSLLITLIQNRL